MSHNYKQLLKQDRVPRKKTRNSKQERKTKKALRKSHYSH